MDYELMNRIKIIFAGYLIRVGDKTDSENDWKGVLSLLYASFLPLLPFHTVIST